ncbi:hypothetical protein Droror1_Dr00020265 [Drosera rotundifolia]
MLSKKRKKGRAEEGEGVEAGCLEDLMEVEVKERMLKKPCSRSVGFEIIISQNPPRDLFLDDRVWNASLIRKLFSPQDADLILQIQIPESSEHDRLAWFFDSKGLFTVRNAYHLELDYRFNTGDIFFKMRYAFSVVKQGRMYPMRFFHASTHNLFGILLILQRDWAN